MKSLSELFAALSLETEESEIDKFLASRGGELAEMIGHELVDRGLHSGDVEDAEIDEITVNSVEIKKVTAFKPTEKGASILVVGGADVQTLVSYTRLNWDEAMYDTEEKALIPFEDVNGESEVELSIDISMSISIDDDGDPVEIEARCVSETAIFYP